MEAASVISLRRIGVVTLVPKGQYVYMFKIPLTSTIFLIVKRNICLYIIYLTENRHRPFRHEFISFDHPLSVIYTHCYPYSMKNFATPYPWPCNRPKFISLIAARLQTKQPSECLVRHTCMEYWIRNYANSERRVENSHAR